MICASRVFILVAIRKEIVTFSANDDLTRVDVGLHTRDVSAVLLVFSAIKSLRVNSFPVLFHRLTQCTLVSLPATLVQRNATACTCVEVASRLTALVLDSMGVR